MTPKEDQALSLEGDFDKYFTLYCPEGFERDALYVFAPDLMALLIDEAGGKHVEVIDDWMFVYRFLGTESFFDESERLFRIVELVGSKALRQTHLYSDPAAGTRRRMRKGRRLSPGIPENVIKGSLVMGALGLLGLLVVIGPFLFGVLFAAR